jgi:intein-encoded DNA endonuclease-like protein
MDIKHRIWNRCLNKNHSGSYSVCCDLIINRKKSIMNFYDKISFSLSRKQEKLINIVKFIRQNDTKGFQHLNAKEGDL